MKPLTISLVWGTHQYQVKTITNSTQYKPGQWLEVAEVAKLCADPIWQVSIADDDTFKMILGFVSDHIQFPTLPIP